MSNATINIFKYDIEHKITEYINYPIIEDFYKMNVETSKSEKKITK